MISSFILTLVLCIGVSAIFSVVATAYGRPDKIFSAAGQKLATSSIVMAVLAGIASFFAPALALSLVGCALGAAASAIYYFASSWLAIRAHPAYSTLTETDVRVAVMGQPIATLKKWWVDSMNKVRAWRRGEEIPAEYR